MRNCRVGLLCLVVLFLISGTSGCTPYNAPENPVNPHRTDTPQNGDKDTYRQIMINELCPSNKGFFPDSNGEFFDWFELYNYGESDVNLSNYSLSDDGSILNKSPLPDYELKSGEYCVVFASGKAEFNSDIYVDFKLSSDGETVFLSSLEGEKISTLCYGAITQGLSVLSDGSVSKYPTPGKANTDENYINFMTRPNDGLIINEVMTTNDNVYVGGEVCDWVEIKNNSDLDINLSEYFITDDSSIKDKCKLPDKTLNPNEVITLLCNDGEQGFKGGVFNCGFKLNGTSESLYIYKGDELFDYAPLIMIPYGFSFGRNSSGTFVYFSKPSPNSDNGDGVAMQLSAPSVDTKPGVYDDIESLEININGEGVIHYTTDGSEPTENSPTLTSAITIDKSCVIRAVAISDDKLKSPVSTFSYIVNEGHTLPVLSLSTDEDNLFDPDTGIYVEGNHENYYQDWEKPINLSFFDGSRSFNIDCGLKMFGSGSRKDCEKKSFRVNFKSKYGMDKLRYNLFSNGVTEFKSLIMRAGEDSPSTIFRNELFTSIASESMPRLVTQSHRYCVLYINGEYFGIYCLAEHLSEFHFAKHMKIKEADVLMHEAPVSRYSPMFDLMEYAVAHDMRQDDNFEYIEDRLDLESMIDWFIIQAYSHNRDIDGNIRYFCNKTTGKWQIAFYDLDWAFYRRGTQFEILTWDGHQYNLIMRELLKNDKFLDMFLSRLSYHLDNALSDEAVLSRIDYYYNLLKPEIERERSKWEGTPEGWERAVNKMRKYVTDQDLKTIMIDSAQKYIGFSDEVRKKYFG